MGCEGFEVGFVRLGFCLEFVCLFVLWVWLVGVWWGFFPLVLGLCAGLNKHDFLPRQAIGTTDRDLRSAAEARPSAGFVLFPAAEHWPSPAG